MRNGILATGDEQVRSRGYRQRGRCSEPPRPSPTSADGFDFGKNEPFYGRRMLAQLNRGESRHRLAPRSAFMASAGNSRQRLPRGSRRSTRRIESRRHSRLRNRAWNYVPDLRCISADGANRSRMSSRKEENSRKTEKYLQLSETFWIFRDRKCPAVTHLLACQT